MGIKQNNLILNRVYSLNLPYSDYDKLIYLLYKYIKNEIDKEIIKNNFEYINIDELNDLKSNDIKKKIFLSWFKMWYENDETKKFEKIDISDINPLFNFKNKKRMSINMESIKLENNNNFLKNKNLYFSVKHKSKKNISNIIKNNDENENQTEISECEKGLRKYFSKNLKEFNQKTIIGPSEPFRIISWMICSYIPENRNPLFYKNILNYPLDIEIENLIIKDIQRSMEENKLFNKEINESLYRILRAMALIDQEMSYCQGMNFICGFMLLVGEGNEIDSFFLLMSLFSQTFDDKKFGIRGFYLDKFPLLGLYLFIFKYLLNKKLNKISEHFKKIELPLQSYVSKWFQTLFVHILPVEYVIRLWDGIFVVGLKFIISFTLSLLNIFQNELLNKEDIIEVYNFFNSFSDESSFKKKNVYNIENIIESAQKNYFINDEEFDKIKKIYLNKKEFEGDEKELEEYSKDLDKIYLKYDYLNIKEFEIINKEIEKVNEENFEIKNNENKLLMDQINTIMLNTDFSEINLNIQNLNYTNFDNI